MKATPAQIKAWRERDYSWSQHSSWLWNPADWFSKYVLGLPSGDSAELRFGKMFADMVEAGTPLAPMTILSKVEHPFKVPHDGFTLIGYADTIDDKTFKEIGEYKTGVKPWDQKRADEHGQITMYAFMNYIQNGIRPEDVKLFLEWVPTRKVRNPDGFTYDIVFRDDEPKPVRFDTKRTMLDVLKFGADIKRTRSEMEAYIKSQV